MTVKSNKGSVDKTVNSTFGKPDFNAKVPATKLIHIRRKVRIRIFDYKRQDSKI
jgi:hypothetical protein